MCRGIPVHGRIPFQLGNSVCCCPCVAVVSDPFLLLLLFPIAVDMEGHVEDVPEGVQDEEEEPGMQVVLNEDKKYYPSADEVKCGESVCF